MTSSNILYLVIGALLIVTASLGYQLYRDHAQPNGVQINVGPSGASIERN